MTDQREGRALFAADRVFDGTDRPPLEAGALLVEDGRIVAVDRLSTFEPLGLTAVRHHGATLLPGLIDGHVHLELAAGPDHEPTLEAWRRDHAARTLGLRAQQHARAALAAGITTLRDCGASWGILAVRAALAAAHAAPRLLVTGPPVTTRGGHCHWFGGEADGEDALRRVTAELCDAGVDAVKVMATGGVMTAGSDPGAIQYDAASLRVVVDEAHRRGRAVVVHANATPGIADALAAGADVIDHLGWLDAVGEVRPDADLTAALGAMRQLCGMTTSGIVRRELDGGADGHARLRARFADKAALHAAGARLHLHSDAGVRFTPVDRPDLGLQVAVIGTGLPVITILAAMTSVAAEAVGLGGEIGVLRPGARADLLVVAGDPTSDPAALRDVREVRRDGRLVARWDHEAGRMQVTP